MRLKKADSLTHSANFSILFLEEKKMGEGKN